MQRTNGFVEPEPITISANKATLTIVTTEGKATEYTDHIIDVYTVGDRLFTEKLSLTIGEYKVTNFGLINESNEVVYATPKEGTNDAALVASPLDIAFNVNGAQTSSIDIEVVEILEGTDPQEYGFNFFEISTINTIDILVLVSELGSTTSITSKVEVIYGENSFTVDLPNTTSYIRIPYQDTDDYIINISSAGYQSSSETLTPVELKAYDKGVTVYLKELLPHQ